MIAKPPGWRTVSDDEGFADGLSKSITRSASVCERQPARRWSTQFTYGNPK